MSAWIDEVVTSSEQIRAELTQHSIVGRFVDSSFPIPKPFLGTGEIKLIVIGQDPTVQRPESRSRIKTVLNLDSSGSLTRYLDDICMQLGINRRENLYATNACKNFFTDPPTSIQANHNVNVLEESAAYWLPLLRNEVMQFPQAAVISLGEPVLNLLVREHGSRLMKYYWGYSRDWQKGITGTLGTILPEFSILDRLIFPFPHQPSLRKAFYSQHLQRYIDFVGTQTRLSNK